MGREAFSAFSGEGGTQRIIFHTKAATQAWRSDKQATHLEDARLRVVREVAGLVADVTRELRGPLRRELLLAAVVAGHVEINAAEEGNQPESVARRKHRERLEATRHVRELRERKRGGGQRSEWSKF